METKKCSSCQEVKPLSAFNRKGKWYQAPCRECAKKRLKQHYQDNKQYYHKKSKRHRRAVVEKMRELKNVPCMDCGRVFPPIAMDFDHRPDEDKEFEISKCKDVSEARLLAEIAKCDIVCACCHRIRTHARRQK